MLMSACQAGKHGATTSNSAELSPPPTGSATAGPTTSSPVLPKAGSTMAMPMNLDVDAFHRLNRGDIIAVGTVGSLHNQTILEVYPGIHVGQFKLVAGATVLRGRLPASALVSYSTRDENKIPRVGDKIIIGVRRLDENLEKTDSRYVGLIDYQWSPQLEATARYAARVPVGWKVVAGKLVSPYSALKCHASLGAKAPAGRCNTPWRGSKVPDDVVMSVRQVAPAKPIRFSNPYGDGRFEITLTNTGQTQARLDDLLSTGTGASRRILWSESLVVLHLKNTELHPSARPLPADAAAVVLQPGESVSTVVDMLPLDSIVNHGGARIRLTFAIGNRSVSSFFYYASSLHQAMRAKARSKLGLP